MAPSRSIKCPPLSNPTAPVCNVDFKLKCFVVSYPIIVFDMPRSFAVALHWHGNLYWAGNSIKMKKKTLHMHHRYTQLTKDTCRNKNGWPQWASANCEQMEKQIEHIVVDLAGVFLHACRDGREPAPLLGNSNSDFKTPVTREAMQHLVLCRSNLPRCTLTSQIPKYSVSLYFSSGSCLDVGFNPRTNTRNQTANETLSHESYCWKYPWY